MFLFWNTHIRKSKIKNRDSEGSEVEEDSFFSTSAEASVVEEENFILFAFQKL